MPVANDMNSIARHILHYNGIQATIVFSLTEEEHRQNFLKQFSRGVLPTRHALEFQDTYGASMYATAGHIHSSRIDFFFYVLFSVSSAVNGEGKTSPDWGGVRARLSDFLLRYRMNPSFADQNSHFEAHLD